jgi:hypothetical protein
VIGSEEEFDVVVDCRVGEGEGTKEGRRRLEESEERAVRERGREA